MKAKNFIMAVCLFGAIAQAHVSVSPRQSKSGATEHYLVRVPTEGSVATVSVDLDVPPGVNVSEISAPAGAKYQAKREGDRITTITWTMEIKPGDSGEFSFTAQNPPDVPTLVWKAHQHFADGTTTDWSGPAGDRRPAPVTKLTEASGGK